MKWNKLDRMFEITTSEKNKIFSKMKEKGYYYGPHYPTVEEVEEKIVPYLFEEGMIMYALWLLNHPDAKISSNKEAYDKLKKELFTVVTEVDEYSNNSTSDLPKTNPFISEG